MNGKIAVRSILDILSCKNGRELFETCTTIIDRDGVVQLVKPEKATQYFLRQNNAIVVELPELDDDMIVAIGQIALAVGRRLERFERGRKSNASRTAESRQKVAQNAIQARWSAK